MFAIIRTGGKQYKVTKGDRIFVEKLDIEAGKDHTFDQVLMVGDDKDQTIGTPFVPGASVVATVEVHSRTKKVIVFKKKRRHNYRRKKGHRQHISVLVIGDINVGGKKASAPKKDTAKSETKATVQKVEDKKSTAPKKSAASEKKAAPKAATKSTATKKAAPKKSTTAKK